MAVLTNVNTQYSRAITTTWKALVMAHEDDIYVNNRYVN